MKDRATLVCSDFRGLSIRRQCEVLEVPRSSLYYKPKGENEINLKLMGIMDRHLTDHPTEGVVSMVYLLTGRQYTSALWINYLEGLDIKVSMDGKGRALDNVYIERFWKSVKYDYIYLNPSEDGYDLLKGVKWYIEYYNQKVHHTTREKPRERYFGATQKAA